MATTAKVLNWENKEVGQIPVSKDFFEQEANLPLLHEVVRWQRSRSRKGNHKAKTRAEVRGGGKKPHRQKGTGHARQGSSRSPLNRAGGVTFGPKPKSHDYRLPARVRKAGLKQALSLLWRENKVSIIEDMHSPEGKTKELVKRFKQMGWKQALLATPTPDPLFQRACANLKNFQVLPVKALNPYDILKYHFLILSPEGMKWFSTPPPLQQEEKKAPPRQAADDSPPQQPPPKGEPSRHHRPHHSSISPPPPTKKEASP